MLFVLTLVYVVLSHLSPQELVPDLAPYRILLWLGALAGAVLILRAAIRPELWRAPQTYLMLGLTFAVPFSRISHLWFGGAWPALSTFFVSGIVYFLVAASTDSARKVKMLAGSVVLTAIYLLSQSLYSYHVDGASSRFVFSQRLGDPGVDTQPDLARIRAVGFLEDPNDFAQFLLVSLALLSVAWQPRRRVHNFVFVLLPGAYLLYGVYSTHSRGALFGLAALVFLALNNRFSHKTSLVMTTSAVALLVLLQAAGPRAISIGEGSAAGRVEAWGTGIAMLKASPLFGAGFDLFLNYNDLTAHNSFVLCFAELGLFGYFLWLGLIVFTTTDLNAIIRNAEVVPSPELVRYARAIRAALLTFAFTSWFLSRTYIVTFYLLIGIGVALRELVRQEMGDEILETRQSKPWALTGGVAAATLVLVYFTVRLRWM